MKRLLVLLSILALCTGAGNGVTMNGSNAGIEIDSFTSFANFPVDFEANQTCTSYAAISAAGSYDCQNTTGVLNGSFDSQNSSTPGTVDYVFGEEITDGRTIRCDFLFEYSGGTGTGNELVRFRDGAVDHGGRLKSDHNGNHIVIKRDNDTGPVNCGDSSMSAGTTYKMRIEYNTTTDQMDFWQTPDATGEYGDGDTCNGSTTGGTGPVNGIDGVRFHEEDTGVTTQIDDVNCGTL